MKTREVKIGDITIGGDNPVAVQSMTNTDTFDTSACVGQIKKIRENGCRIVRLTTQGVKQAENLSEIREGLLKEGINDVCLVADVHFNPEVAFTAALTANKVRINPGNFTNDKGQFQRLLCLCREKNIPVRIGVNHGSLAENIVELYGDTPEGMVESAYGFIEEALRNDFRDIVVSMKSSNARVMVEAYRLLAQRMQSGREIFPVHLGVTEAGDGLYGRIKSAVGIATLLVDGIGDTVRVSLTEDPEKEIPVANEIIDYVEEQYPKRKDSVNYRHPEIRRSLKTNTIGVIGGIQNPPRVSYELGQKEHGNDIRFIEYNGTAPVWEWRKSISQTDPRTPVIIKRRYDENDIVSLAIKASCDFGPMLMDSLADGIIIENSCDLSAEGFIPPVYTQELTAFAGKGIPYTDIIGLMILQAARERISGTEYIACPGCGRTLFDLQNTLREVKSATSHLTGLKIGVMGCIVNGPGEMADADYGYVGAGPGRVTLYRGKEAIKKNIPQEEAIRELIEIIENDRG